MRYIEGSEHQYQHKTLFPSLHVLRNNTRRFILAGKSRLGINEMDI